MIRILKTFGIALALTGISAAPGLAAPFTVNVNATIQSVTGSYVADLSPLQALTATYALDTSETAAFNAITTPSVVPGHEFTSFYEFASPPYSGDVTAPGVGSFTAAVLGIVVNNDLPLSSGDTGGILPTGTYDWIELLGSTTSSICLEPGGVCAPDQLTPADGEEWTLAIFGDSSWFTDGSVIPDELPASFVSLLVGIDIDENGDEVGFVFATVDSFSSNLPQAEATEVSTPATAGLAGLFLIAAARIRRRR